MQCSLARVLRYSLLAVIAAGTSIKSGLRAAPPATATSFVRTLAFKQKLRVCNAYPYDTALEVYLAEKKLTLAPLAYKSCGEFMPELHVDDEISFKVEENNAGTFTINELPQNDAILLMVIYRHDNLGSSVAFESHVFSSMASSQIAVMDTYRGVAKSEIRIQDIIHHDDKGKLRRSEMLRYDNVVAVDPGVYEVYLQANQGMKPTVQAKAELVALHSEAYVVIRCGVEAQEGESYPQELMVFPFSDKSQLGGAAGHALSLWALALAMLSVFYATRT